MSLDPDIPTPRVEACGGAEQGVPVAGPVPDRLRPGTIRQARPFHASVKKPLMPPTPVSRPLTATQFVADGQEIADKTG